MNLFNELKRRNVFKVAAAYAIVSWLILQVVSSIVPIIEAPDWVSKTILMLLVVGFPVALLFAWAFELTPEGIKKESDVVRDESITTHTSSKINLIIIGALVLIIGGFAYDKFFGSSTTTEIALNELQSSKHAAKNALNDNSSASSPINDKSIAVLPFSNRSNREDDQFFVDGMHDDLLTKLAKSHEMRVISRTSVLEYRNTTKKIPEIARELGVSNILEGGVQRSGSHIRVNAQLIDAKNDQHLWAETYDRELTIDNVFAIQTEVTLAIAKALEATLSPKEQQQINKPLTNNLLAWQTYQQGFSIFGHSSDNKKAIDLFKKTIELDPKFAVAYAQLSTAEMTDYWFGQHQIEQRQNAWKYIEMSRALDNNSSELFTAEAAYYYWGFRDFDKALASARKAIDLAPSNVVANQLHGYLLRRIGRFDESIKMLDYSASLSPKSMLDYQENAETSVSLLRYDDAEKYIAKVIKIDPKGDHIENIQASLVLYRDGNLLAANKLYAVNKDIYIGDAYNYWWTLLAMADWEKAINFSKTSKKLADNGPFYASNEHMLGLTYFIQGDKKQSVQYLSESIKELEILLTNAIDNKNYLVALCKAYGALGNADQANNYCSRALIYKKDSYDYPFDLILIVEGYMMLGDKERALQLLEESLEYKVRNSAHSLRLNPFLKPLLDDPRFEILIQRIDSGELVESNES